MTEPLFRLHWRKADGTICSGQPLPKETAAAWLANACLNTPQFDYWIEPVGLAVRTAA
jgi:hypothetical protein